MRATSEERKSGEESLTQSEDDAARRPDIRLLGIVEPIPREHLGTRISESASPSLIHVWLGNRVIKSAHPKVGKLQSESFGRVYEDVVDLCIEVVAADSMACRKRPEESVRVEPDDVLAHEDWTVADEAIEVHRAAVPAAGRAR